MRKVICNTSCLIALSNIGRLGLLKDIYGSVFITEMVSKFFYGYKQVVVSFPIVNAGSLCDYVVFFMCTAP